MFGHERSLVTRFADRPFVLLGVNGDEDRATLLQIQEQSGLTWRSVWDGQDGAISKAFGVESLPTLILIDAAGKIRHRQEGRPAVGVLEKKIEALLTEIPPLATAKAS